jgi:hypothetical protein
VARREPAGGRWAFPKGCPVGGAPMNFGLTTL